MEVFLLLLLWVNRISGFSLPDNREPAYELPAWKTLLADVLPFTEGRVASFKYALLSSLEQSR